MDARFLDMLHHPGDPHGVLVGQDVDVHLDRVLQVAIDQDRTDVRSARGVGHEAAHLVERMDDAHRPSAEHVGGPDNQRISQHLGLLQRVGDAEADGVLRLAQPEPVEQLLEPLAVLGQIDRIRRRAENRHARLLQRMAQLERRLPTKLHDHAQKLAAAALDPADLEHVLGGQRLEIEAIGGVGIGRDRFGVAVDHDGLEPGLAQPERGVHAAIVELDPLPDPVGPAAEDDHLAPV